MSVQLTSDNLYISEDQNRSIKVETDVSKDYVWESIIDTPKATNQNSILLSVEDNQVKNFFSASLSIIYLNKINIYFKMMFFSVITFSSSRSTLILTFDTLKDKQSAQIIRWYFS